jgi:hypothetical protein
MNKENRNKSYAIKLMFKYYNKIVFHQENY